MILPITWKCGEKVSAGRITPSNPFPLRTTAHSKSHSD